jgi:C1A family cysteine protease
MIKYGLGCLPDPPDNRDFLLSAFIPLTVEVPSKFSLRDKMTPIKHQGQLGSCVAFATSAIKEYFDTAEMAKEIDLSEQFLYGECKKIDGFPNVEGTTARAAFTTMSKSGVCEEQYFPYEGQFPPTNSPKSGYLTNAEVFKIKTYVSASGGVDTIRQALYQNGPVSLAAVIYDSFMKSRYNGGFVPAPTGAQLGGHLMCIIGYDDDKEWGGYRGFLEVRNSWGKDYGDNGYVWIPYSVYNQIGAGSQWTIVDVTTVQKHWSDWPNQELEAQDKVYNSGLIKGFPDGTVKPWDNLLRRHVALVMQRLNMTIDTSLLEDYAETTRGWVRDSFPFLVWNEERWDEPLSRYQFVLLLARYLDSLNTIC